MEHKKVICYGLSLAFERLFYGINAIYDIIGASDKNPDKKEMADRYGVEYIVPIDLTDKKFDYIVITSSFSDEISRYLQEELGISEDKIIGFEDFLARQELSLGELNPDKTIYVLRRMDTHNGLNILILEYLYKLSLEKELDDYEIVIDACNYSSIYHNSEEIGKVNIIDYYFKKNSNITIEEAYQSKNVILSSAAMLNEKVLIMTELNRDICLNSLMRDQYRYLYEKYFQINETVEKTLNEQYEKYIESIHNHKKKICAVVDRSGGYNVSKVYGHYIQPDIDWSLQRLEELRGDLAFDYILLDMHLKETEEKYREFFGEMVICTDRTRIHVPMNDNKLRKIESNRENDCYFQGMELLISRYLLARCDYYYSGISGSSTLPVLLGENFENMYIYENGRFGFDDEALTGK